MSGECCEAAIEGGLCNGCDGLDSPSSTSDAESYSFPPATPNRRHASLKVSHYPILLRRNKNHNKNEPASLMWTPGNTLPECCGASTWIINEGIPTTSGAAATAGMKQLETSVQFSTNFKRDKLPKRSESHSSPKSSRDKFFGGRSALGPRNTITWDINGSVQMSPTSSSDGTVMLHPQPKYSLGLSPGTIGSTFIGHESRDRKRKQLWSLSPTAFHQSFDDRNRSTSNPLSNSCGNINEEVRTQSAVSSSGYIPHRRRAAFCSGDTSKGAFAGGYTTAAIKEEDIFLRGFEEGMLEPTLKDYGNRSRRNSGSGFSTGGPNRPPALGGRSPQSSFDSNGDVGQISLNFMRVNGTIASNVLKGTAPTTSKSNQHTSPAPPVGLNVALHSNNGGTITTIAATNPASTSSQQHSPHFSSSHASNIDGRNGISRVGSTPITIEQTAASTFAKRKDSWQYRKISDPVKISIEGDQLSKKSLSLVLSDDPEGGQRFQEDSRTPLMKDEKGGGRLIARQHLFHIRRITSDYALFCAVLGIIVMIIENELSAAGIHSKSSITSLTLKGIILISTAVLLGLVIKFHVHEVQLFMNANSAEDWRIALTFPRCFNILLELTVCGICPLPFNLSFSWTTVHSDGITVSTSEVPIDVFLSIPMLFRLYWFGRVMLLHSRLFTDASSRSIAGLNRVTFNSRFILKTLMTLCPGTMLMMFTASLWVLAGWVLRLCERHHSGDSMNIQAIKHQNYLNSLWFIAITFLSVGYGDVVPNTYCGRSVAVITGILGTCTSSMVVAVIARKLELSRAEKHVHNFMIDTQLTKQLKHSAANVLRETWLIYKYRRLVDKINPSKIRHHQRKFLMAIYALRKVKRDQRKLAENSVSLGDVAKTTSNSYELIHDIHSTQEGLALRMTAVEHQLSDIQREIGNLADILRAAVNMNPRQFTNNDGDSGSVQRESLRKRRVAVDH